MKLAARFCLRVVLVLSGPLAAVPASAVEIFSASGPDAASITGSVDGFRAALGTLNAPAPNNAPDGRREVNWDGAPAAVSAPNAFPGNFFNFTAAPRARGIEFSTPGSELQLSGDVDDNTPTDFTNINPTYGGLFQAFSPERLFTAIGSNIVDVTFFNPANTSQPAYVDGLGVVFSDVDFVGVTRMEFFGAGNGSLGSYDVPNYVGTASDNEHFSFLGVKFDDNVVSRVRIYTGTHPLGVNEDLSNSIDLVVMDDFIFGEPVPVPEPSSTALLTVLSLVGLSARRSARSRA